jgi:type III pantothenate kinase
MSHYILAVDVGNSRIKFGLFDRNDSQDTEHLLPHCLHELAINIGESIPWSEICSWEEFKSEAKVSGIVAGANPDGVNKVVASWPSDGWEPPLVIHGPAGIPISVNLESPEKVGIDRLLNAVAANVIRPDETPVIIVDCGTATTVDLVSADGAFQGGAILPGLELSSRSLHEYTALLPNISIEELASQEHSPLGKDTSEAICSGLFWGQLGAIKELIDRLSQSPIPNPQSPIVLLTGGGAELLAPHLPNAIWEPHLALQGLILVDRHTENL